MQNSKENGYHSTLKLVHLCSSTRNQVDIFHCQVLICNKTHLLVLKVDYTKNEVSLFVDPELGQSEPKADIVVTGEEGALKAGLKSVALRNRNGFKGSIGNFRFAKDWAGAIGK